MHDSQVPTEPTYPPTYLPHETRPQQCMCEWISTRLDEPSLHSHGCFELSGCHAALCGCQIQLLLCTQHRRGGLGVRSHTRHHETQLNSVMDVQLNGVIDVQLDSVIDGQLDSVIDGQLDSMIDVQLNGVITVLNVTLRKLRMCVPAHAICHT